MANWFEKLIGRNNVKQHPVSFLRQIVAGSMYKMSDMRSDSSVADIKTQIDTMRALARDSQISTALAYYATDATTTNTSGQIIWATPLTPADQQCADIINAKFKQYNVNAYARDHILELGTVGNLYIPTSDFYKDSATTTSSKRVAIDNNTIPTKEYDIIPSYRLDPENTLHLCYHGEPSGYMYSDDGDTSNVTFYPESAIIHFSLGGLLGRYTISTTDADGNELTYDIKFAQPLMERAVQPTQTLSLFEDAMLLSSLSRAIKFINVECGNAEEDEVQSMLLQIKDMIEQQMSLNTANGDAQSFLNPQSPNNLIYLAKVNGTDPISITDLNMAESTETDNKLLEHYQNKKLSVLGVPKEAMNFSSAEGLGNAGSVMSQRSALYANSLNRLETAYITGWTEAFNQYFIAHGLSGYANKFELHMNPILTELSQVQFEKRDSTLGQVQTVIDILTNLKITNPDIYKDAIKEITSEVFPSMSSTVGDWDIDVNTEGEGEEMGGGF